MGRPPTPIGQPGKITVREIRPGVFQADCTVRDHTGKPRRIRVEGKSRNAATNALKRKLNDGPGSRASSKLTGSSTVAAAASGWLAGIREQVDAGDRSPRTLEAYESTWKLHVEPALGSLRLAEVDVPTCEDWKRDLRVRKGPPTCSGARAVLSGILGYAVRMGALSANPIREMSDIAGADSRERQPRAMTADERRAFLEFLDTNAVVDPNAPKGIGQGHRPADIIRSRALGDIVRMSFATGARIGEIMALSWDDVDLDAATVSISHKIIRVKGRGLVRLPPKSRSSVRILKLPSWAVSMLRKRRLASGGAYPIFPDSLGGWRDPVLVQKWLRWSREAAGFPWYVSHVGRQTVLSALADELPPTEVRDHAGHSRTDQTEQYVARKIASERAAEILERMV